MHWHDLNPPMYWDMLQTPKNMQRKQNISPRVTSPTTGIVIEIRITFCTVLVFSSCKLKTQLRFSDNTLFVACLSVHFSHF